MLTTRKQPRRLGIFGTGVLLLSSSTDAFCPAVRTLASSRTSRGLVPMPSSKRTLRSSSLVYATSQDQETTTTTESPEQVMDDLLDSGKLRSAIRFLKENPSLEISRERWSKVFDAIEVRTTEAEENNYGQNTRAIHDRALAASEWPLQSPARMEMTNMYKLLKELDHLKLFGATDTTTGQTTTPAAGSHLVTPTLLEKVTDLSMTALTPKPTNTLLFAGVGLAVLEGIVSITTGIDLNFLVFVTLLFAFFDRLLLNGAIFENFLKVFMPGIQNKILRHEAGHFLCAYLMGCPVEGCVLNAWAALQDARFGGRRTNVSAGTSFFDPQLSEQINSSVVTRSSIDRYSIIVMGGIAAEAINFGQADGGAGDEMALVSFLTQMNGRPSKNSSGIPPWNESSIKNQARWGAMEAVLMLRHYKDCYDALVDALEGGGNLGDCIYAIEKAGRDNNLQPLKEPLGYILDKGEFGEWATEKPENIELGPYSTMLEASEKLEASPPPLDEREAQEKLQEYRKVMEEKLRDIDERLKDSE